MASVARSVNIGGSWNNQQPSFGFDVISFIVAIMLHMPLYFVRFDAHKKSSDRPTERLVSVDLIEPELPKPVVEEAPPPPPVAKVSLMDRVKAIMKKEPPPPPPPEKKLEQKLLDTPKPIALEAKLNAPEKIQPKLESKAGFETKLDPTLVQEKKLVMQSGPAGIAPLSAKKLGTIEDRSLKQNKGNFQMAQNDNIKSIGGDGPGLAQAGTPAIAIRTGKAGTTENFSAPPPQKTDKGRIGGAIAPAGLGGDGPKMGLRDSIIARDAQITQIGNTGRAGGVPGGVPGGTGVKKDAGKSFSTTMAGVPGGTGTGVATGNATPKVAPIAPAKKKDKSMFSITGPLKDRKIEKQTVPEYPAWAQAQGIEASVVLEFTVDMNGFVKSGVVVRRTSGYPKLDESAIAALRQWKFVALPEGENREEVGMITFNYSLN